MKYLRALPALFLICAVIATGFSQDAPPSDGKNREKDKDTKTRDKDKKVVQPLEIKTNVAVLDAAGKLVADVKPEDIRIFEDGVEQKIKYFVKKQPLLNLGLVFDNSGSMRIALDEIIKNSAIFTNYLSDQDEAFVVRFVDSEKVEMFQQWTSSKKNIHEAIENMFVEGGPSAVLDGVYLGAEKILEREKIEKSARYALILISDGEDRNSYYKLKDIDKLLADTDLQIFVISFAERAPVDKKGSRFVSHILTLKTGGTTYAMPKKFTKNDLDGAVRSIVGELRSQYIVGYTSTNPNRDGSTRKLTVQIADGANGEKRQGIIREGFVVPKD